MDLTRLLPHAPPMRLMQRVDEVDRERIRGVGRIQPEAPGVHDGIAPAILGVELGAQATAMIAAAALVEQGGDTQPRIGYLVSLRSVSVRVDALPVDVDLRVEARRVGGAGGLEMFEIAVYLPGEDEPSVEGVVGTVLTDSKIGPQPDRLQSGGDVRAKA